MSDDLPSDSSVVDPVMSSAQICSMHHAVVGYFQGGHMNSGMRRADGDISSSLVDARDMATATKQETSH